MKDAMKYLKLICVLLFSALALVACSDKDKDGEVRWDRKSLFMNYGETAVVGIGGKNIATFSISSVPDGWATPEINTRTMSVTIVAPASADDVANEDADSNNDGQVDFSGTIQLKGVTHGNEVVYASLFVSLETPEVDLSKQPANSYIANTPAALYRINASVKGDGSAIPTASVAVVWQTSTNLVKYLQLENDGTATFYLAKDTDEEYIKRGNALIGAYDADKNLLWSWHIWAADYDAEAEALNYGKYTVMSRALGQLQNDTEDKASILESYGMYYQAGRKDPFAGPSTYNASKGVTASLYDGESNVVTIEAIEADSETGTYAYATAHPTHFLTVSDKNGSWDKGLTQEVKGWNTPKKSVNDPCPYGWRVAPAAAFDGAVIADDLTISDAASKYAEQYGWTLEKNGVQSFYFAGGRRVYADALIQNVFDESLTRNVAMEAQPWVGYNWTAEGKTFAFWFSKENPTQSGLRNDLSFSKANGMMVRCVKE